MMIPPARRKPIRANISLNNPRLLNPVDAKSVDSDMRFRNTGNNVASDKQRKIPERAAKMYPLTALNSSSRMIPKIAPKIMIIFYSQCGRVDLKAPNLTHGCLDAQIGIIPNNDPLNFISGWFTASLRSALSWDPYQYHFQTVAWLSLIHI